MTLDRKEMGDRHEAWLAKMLGGRQTRGSGNQWRDPMDGRNNRYTQPFAWAWDGKSTMGKSISISREVLDKAVEQADGERPMIAIRFYEDERLRHYEDWILVREGDFFEMNAEANRDHDESCGCHG